MRAILAPIRRVRRGLTPALGAMKNRGFWYLITAAMAISYAVKFLELYGRALLIAVAISIAVFIFGRFIGPKLPAYLGGDPKPQTFERPERELELYEAMEANDLVRAKDCIARGADPFKKFSIRYRPFTTNSDSCYEHAKSAGHLNSFLRLFNTSRNGT